MLPRAGFGDDARLAHADGEQRLAERVVDFVRAGVCEIFALEKNLRAAVALREPCRLVNRRRTSDVVLQQTVQFARKRRIVANRQVRALQLLDWRDERLGYEAAAEFAEVPARVRIAPSLSVAPCKASKRARMRP